MLNSILIENFKSYKSARLPLAPLTLMIGANASGKTNAIEAFRFLSWVVGGEKLSTIKNRINDSERIFRGDVRDLVYKGAESFTLGAEVGECDFRIGIGMDGDELTIVLERLSKILPDLQAIYWIEKYDYLSDPERTIHFRNPYQKRLEHQTRQNAESFEYITALTSCEASSLQFVLKLFNMVEKLYGKNSDQSIVTNDDKAVKEILSILPKTLFFDLIPSAMRGDSYPETQLRNTGANLAGVLYTLWQDTDQQAHILEFIQSLPEQDIKALKFYTDHRGRVELALIETFGNQDQEQHIELLSDGTLRVLAIAAALLSAPEGSTIVIEEVDNGVHPSRAKQLLTTMREHAERRGLRLLLSTHNPALMDALPDEALGDVVFCYRDPKEGDSRLVRLSDLDDYMGLVMQGSLGQLVTRGVVDRFVKNPVTPEEKKQKALDWLAMMQGDDE